MIEVSYAPLEAILEKRGISKGQLARGAGLSKATLAKIGNNESLSLEVLGRISLYLDEPLGQLVSFRVSNNKSEHFRNLLQEPTNRDFKQELLASLVHSSLLLSKSKRTAKDVASFLRGELDLFDSKEDAFKLPAFSKTVAAILDRPGKTLDASFVNELVRSLIPLWDTNASKSLWKTFSRFTFAWTTVPPLSPEDQASFANQFFRILDGREGASSAAYLLLLKVCLLSNSYMPLLNEELAAYFNDGIATYQDEPAYLISAIESGIEQTKSLMKRHFVAPL